MWVKWWCTLIPVEGEADVPPEAAVEPVGESDDEDAGAVVGALESSGKVLAPSGEAAPQGAPQRGQQWCWQLPVARKLART